MSHPVYTKCPKRDFEFTRKDVFEKNVLDKSLKRFIYRFYQFDFERH